MQKISTLFIYFVFYGHILKLVGSSRKARDDITNTTEIIVKNLTKNKMESASINSGAVHLWKKELNFDRQDDLYRIGVALPTAGRWNEDQVSLVQFCVSHGRESVAFHLPERIGNGTIVYETSRFLHPLYMTKDRERNVQQSLILSVQTTLSINVDYTLHIRPFSEGQYVIRFDDSGIWNSVNQKVNVGKIEAYFWDTSDVETAKLAIRSEDPFCGILYLNNRQESLYYVNREINTDPSAGFRAISFSRRLDLKLDRESLKDQLFLYILLQPEDSLCDPNGPSRNFNQHKSFNISISIEEEKSYFLPLAMLIGFFLSTPLFLLVYVISQLSREGAERLENEPQPLVDFEPLVDIQPNDSFQQEPFADPQARPPQSVEEEEPLPEVSEVQNAGAWSHGDLHFVFYMIPAIVLSAFQYFDSLSSKRIEDLCFHNYGCAKSWRSFVAFNHLISNVGYILNGLYYTVFVLVRNRNRYNGRGSFTNSGLELSLGAALACQGLASGVYHVCPSRVFFSYDTPFMQVMSVLAMLKIYGNRHGGVTPSRANGVISVVLAVNVVISIAGDSLWPRLLEGVAQIVFIVFLLSKISKDTKEWVKHPPKKILLDRNHTACGIIAVSVNLLLALGHVLNRGTYQSNQLVTIICIINMCLYSVYYYYMKVQAKERHNWLSTSAGAASLVLWTAAAFFFFKEETNWKLTPALSRNLNSDCCLLSFFDRHDIWHLLSAQAALLSLVALSTIDDAQAAFPQKDLAVF